MLRYMLRSFACCLLCVRGVGDLPGHGEDVLTTTQDDPSMLTTFKPAEALEGVVLRKVAVPVPAENPEEIVGLLEAGIPIERG
jgi:hypothetical protein